MRQDGQDDLLFLLHDVARLVRVAADRRARGDGMTRAQWVLLLRLWRHPGASQRELADVLEVEPITVARLVDRLERNGLLERRADASDRRVWRLHLTAAAGPVLRRIGVQRAGLAAVIGEGVAPDVQAAMLVGLTRMKANLVSRVAAGGEAGGALEEAG